MYLACKEGKLRMVKHLYSNKIYFQFQTYIRNNRDIVSKMDIKQNFLQAKNQTILNSNNNDNQDLISQNIISQIPVSQNSQGNQEQEDVVPNSDVFAFKNNLIKFNKNKESSLLKKDDNKLEKLKIDDISFNSSVYNQSNDRFLNISIMANSRLKNNNNISTKIHLINNTNKSNLNYSNNLITLNENKNTLNLKEQPKKEIRYNQNDYFKYESNNNALFSNKNFDESMIPNPLDENEINPNTKRHNDNEINSEGIDPEQSGMDEQRQDLFSSPLIHINSENHYIYQENILMSEEQIIAYFESINLNYVKMRSNSPKAGEDKFQFTKTEYETCIEVVCRLGYTEILDYILNSNEFSNITIKHLLTSSMNNQIYVTSSCFNLLFSKLSFCEKVDMYLNCLKCCKC